MLRPVTGSVCLAIALATAAPAFAQSEAPPNSQTETQFVGFPVYSSDGQQLGQVIQVAMADGKLRAVRAELGQFLGLGTATVMINADVVEQKADRLEVTMTAEEVRAVVMNRKQ
ncbi:MAG: PRC-barrel domain containing protein [Sphingomonadales bacterium]|nr:PRC-barrel domain containing protein [Sphingomonadales bacterium]